MKLLKSNAVTLILMSLLGTASAQRIYDAKRDEEAQAALQLARVERV